MRTLHRDIGFFTIGLVIIYSLSGILLIYRDTNLLKITTQVKKELPVKLDASELGKALHIRGFKELRSDDEKIYFENGWYNKKTGNAEYTTKSIPIPFSTFIDFHKLKSSKLKHLLGVIFGVLLLFLAISSFWMLKKGSKQLRRGIIISVAGIIFSVIILLL